MSSCAKRVIVVSVRQLVDLALRTGDLGGSGNFVSPNRALAGTRGHQQVQRSRPEGYRKEIPLAYDIEAGSFVLRVQGRLDGILETNGQVLLEEIKTVDRHWDRRPDPLHWAQAKIYAFIYAQQHVLSQIEVRLVYLNLDSGETTDFAEQFVFSDLGGFFHQTASIYLEWVRDWEDWRQRRDQSIRALDFPFQEYRPGQRNVAVAVYRAIARQQRLFVEAPTGIGKTVSVLFPSLKALAEGKIERIFYLTARTTARAAAEKAFADLRQAGALLRTLTLTAKEKICVRQGQPCDPQTCPLAVGYFDRRKSAMTKALHAETITRSTLESVGQEHQVCPFELALDLSSWVDAVICDYNYVFDPAVYLRRHFGEVSVECVFLVDEAHNLVDRAREMFSAELTLEEIQAGRRAILEALPGCAKALSKLGSTLRKLAKHETDTAEEGLNLGIAERGRSSAELPEALLRPLEKALQAAELWLSQNEDAEFRGALLELYFRLSAFARTAQRYDERYRTLFPPGPNAAVRLFCLDPSRLLDEALGRGTAAVLFSATLSPLEYYRELLGGRSEDPLLQLASPFPAENLAVVVHDGIATDYKRRGSTIAAAAEAIGTFAQGRRGNYLVYFPSYQYLNEVRRAFEERFPATALVVQEPRMSDAARENFLQAFGPDQHQLGFAVLGGVFGEAIDLVGERLIGAIIIGVGLPQLCLERDLIRDYFQATIGRGFEYAYAYPGMNRVLQAVGRVIRSDTDRGAVLLVDTRFGEHRYRRLFPRWWQPRRVRALDLLSQHLHAFWNDTE